MFRRSTAVTGALFLFAVAFPFCQVAQGAPSTAPAFLWSSESVFSASADGRTSRISHEVKQAGFLFGLVDVLAGKSSQNGEYLKSQDLKRPDAIIVLIGQSGKASSVLEAKNAVETAPLRQAFSSASSSLALPFLQNMGAELSSTWQTHLQQAGVSSDVIGACASGSSALSPEAATHGIQAALSKSSQVILVCSGEEASLEQEMQLLEAATAAAGSSSVVLGFIVQPAQGGVKSVGRSLLEASSASGSMLRLPTEDDLAAVAASRDATAAAIEELAQSRLSSSQMAGLASDSKLTPSGFQPVPGGFNPSSLPIRPGNQGGDTPFQGLVCDDKCQVQVTMIEVAILGFTMISALVSGSWLLHGVGTPTRFETSKESQHSQ